MHVQDGGRRRVVAWRGIWPTRGARPGHATSCPCGPGRDWRRERLNWYFGFFHNDGVQLISISIRKKGSRTYQIFYNFKGPKSNFNWIFALLGPIWSSKPTWIWRKRKLHPPRSWSLWGSGGIGWQVKNIAIFRGSALDGLSPTFFHDVTQQMVSREEWKSAPYRRFDQQQ